MPQPLLSAAPVRVAVIGAGIAGLACARALTEAGHAVTVFDKGRAPGGRLTTKRLEPYAFDLGAQYLTVQSPRFMAQVEAWLAAKVCQPWHGRCVELDERGRITATPARARYVGTPGMSALAGSLAEGLALRPSHRVDRLVARGAAYGLVGAVMAGHTLPPGAAAGSRADATPSAASIDLGEFDRLAICLPAPQAAQLLATHDLLTTSPLAATARAATLAPCRAIGVVATPADAPAFAALQELPFEGAMVRGHASLAWIARNSSKPARPAAPAEQWVLHATASWSRAHATLAPGDAAVTLLAAFTSLVGVPSWKPSVAHAHAWTYARAEPQPTTSPAAGASYDRARGVGLAGDWLADGRIEGAYLAGVGLANAMLAAHDDTTKVNQHG